MGAALERPVAPRRDNLDVGVQRVSRKLEADLIIALAGCPMRDRVGAGLGGDVDQVLGDQRAGDRGAEQVDAFIDGIGAEHRKDRKSVVEGKSVSVRVDLGGRRILKKKTHNSTHNLLNDHDETKY